MSYTNIDSINIVNIYLQKQYFGKCMFESKLCAYERLLFYTYNCSDGKTMWLY